MKKKMKFVFLVVAGLFLAPAALSAQVPSWLISPALDFVNNPDDFLYNLHLDNVDYSPARTDRAVSLRTNFLLTTLPFTWLNLNAKGKILNDGGMNPWVPQVDIVGSYGRIIMLDILPSVVNNEDDGDDMPEPSMKDYSIGLTLSKAVSPETSIFTGFHHSVMTLNLKLPGTAAVEITDEVTLDSLAVRRRDNILITGISNKLAPGRSITAYVGYGFNYDKIFSRIVWQRRRLEMGFNIYPEGLLVVHPFLGWHWSF